MTMGMCSDEPALHEQRLHLGAPEISPRCRARSSPLRTVARLRRIHSGRTRFGTVERRPCRAGLLHGAKARPFVHEAKAVTPRALCGDALRTTKNPTAGLIS